MLAVLSGVAVFSLDEGRGVFRFLYRHFYEFATPLKLAHLGVVYLLLAIIFAHISIVLLEALKHKTGIIAAMFTGEKPSSAKGISLTTTKPLTLLSFAWVLSPLFAVFHLSTAMGTTQPAALAIPPIYKKECAACHMAFPPNTLPAESWKSMLANLQDHFGDDASIDESLKREIEQFLVKNAAEYSLEESSIKFIRSIGKDNPPLRITAIPYWQEKHKTIPQEIYRRGSIKSKINCIACHKWSEYGAFDDSDIRIPRN